MSSTSTCEACAAPLIDQPPIHCRSAHHDAIDYRPCPECGLWTITPFPDSSQIVRFYDQTAYGTGATKFPLGFRQLFEAAQRRRANWIQALAGPPGKRRILDIGCGDGTLLRQLAAWGWEIHGTELPGQAADRARHVQGLQLITGEFRDDSYPAGSFDVITLWHVLEHVPAPVALLACCRKLLKPDGWLVIEVPNLGGWQGRLFARHWLHLDPPRHLRQFTSRALEGFLGQTGFTPVTQATNSLVMGLMGWVQSSLNFVIRPRDLLYHLILSRGRFPAPVAAKICSVLGAGLLLPPALVLALLEALAGRGPVLRYACRPR